MFEPGNSSCELTTKGTAMLRTILATLVIVGIFAASTAAQAAPAPNTPFGNGTVVQGTDWNGALTNGQAMNGGEWNGYAVNGNAVNGAEVRTGTVTIVDIKLPDGTTFQAK
jgi:hypothetical protein